MIITKFTKYDYKEKAKEANSLNKKLYVMVTTVGEDEEETLEIADNNYYVCYKANYTRGEVNPNYESEKETNRRKYLDSLTLTPADVERALFKAKGMDFEDLKNMIATHLPQLNMKALSIEFRASNFFRGAKVGNIRLFDIVGQMLGYTSNDMDYLFLNKELPS